MKANQKSQAVTFSTCSFTILVAILTASITYAQFSIPVPRPDLLAEDKPISKGPSQTKSLGDFLGLFPVKDSAQAEYFWNQKGFSPLKTASVSGWENRGAAFLEFMSGFIGTVRWGLGGVVASSDESDSTGTITNLQRFLSGGGNATFSIAFPILAKFSKNTGYGLILLPILGGDLPAAGNRKSDPDVNLSLGTDLVLSIIDNKKTLFILPRLRTAYVLGTDKFYSGLGNKNNRPFFYGQASVSFVFEQFVISYGGVLWGPEPMSAEFKSQLTMSISR